MKLGNQGAGEWGNRESLKIAMGIRSCNLDGPAIRDANRGDSRESIRRKTPIFITFERFARIASNLRFAMF